MTTTTLSAVLGAILRGELDEHEEKIYAALKERRRSIAFEKSLALNVGDKVRIVNIRPKYLVGLEAEIDFKRGKGFVLKGLGPAAGIYAASTFPADALEAI